uniref:Uncharacterized protein n=1 Tax=Leersia perrieri TaxID=77586 RepID=A0A0D9WF75_9ORYZ
MDYVVDIAEKIVAVEEHRSVFGIRCPSRFPASIGFQNLRRTLTKAVVAELLKNATAVATHSVTREHRADHVLDLFGDPQLLHQPWVDALVDWRRRTLHLL